MVIHYLGTIIWKMFTWSEGIGTSINILSMGVKSVIIRTRTLRIKFTRSSDLKAAKPNLKDPAGQILSNLRGGSEPKPKVNQWMLIYGSWCLDSDEGLNLARRWSLSTSLQVACQRYRQNTLDAKSFVSRIASLFQVQRFAPAYA